MTGTPARRRIARLFLRGASALGLSIGLVAVGAALPAAALVTTPASNIVRLLPNGVNDEAFGASGTGSGLSGTVNAMVQQADGMVVVGGDFASFTGLTWNGSVTSTTASTVAVGHIARFTSDGALDLNFSGGAGTGFSGGTGLGTAGAVYALKIDASGNILVGGNFDSYTAVGGSLVEVNQIARLTSDGDLDLTFPHGSGTGFALNGTSPYTHQGVRSIAIDSSNNILVAGGPWGSYAATSGNSYAVKGIVRLADSGALDQSFSFVPVASGSWDGFYSIAVDASDRIIAGGSFNSFTPVGDTHATGRSLVRLTSTGAVDTTFTSGAGMGFAGSGLVMKVALDSSGNILVGGKFSAYSTTAGSTDVTTLVRLDSSGEVDSTFTHGTGTGFGAIAEIYAIEFTPSGDVIVGGLLGSYSVGGSSTSFAGIAQLTSTGEVATTFSAGSIGIASSAGMSRIYALVLQPSGNVVAGGLFQTYRDKRTKVTFADNGGSGSMADQLALPSSALSSNGFTRTGYVFTGWTTAANGSGTVYGDSATFPFASDATLYAQWTAVPVAPSPPQSSYSPPASESESLSSGASTLASRTLAQTGVDVVWQGAALTAIVLLAVGLGLVLSRSRQRQE